MGATAALQFGEDLLRIAEGEVMQHHHVFLVVEHRLLHLVDDQRCCQHLLLLQTHVRMHPVGAGAGIGEVIVLGAAWRDRRLAIHGNTILPEGRREAVPVDDRVNVGVVLDLHTEMLAEHHGQARLAVGPGNSIDGRRLALHLEHALRHGEELRLRIGKGKARKAHEGRSGEAGKKKVTTVHVRSNSLFTPMWE